MLQELDARTDSSTTIAQGESTDRSPRFRAFVIILLLAVSCFLVYVSAFRKDTTEFTKGSVPGHHANVGRLEQPAR